MEENAVLNNTCPHCGAPLPENAAFCPHCARSINQRTELTPPRPPAWWKALRVGIPLLVLAGIVLGIHLYNRPRAYDDSGTAEVIYTDKDGTYQLLVGWSNDRYTPAPKITQRAELDGEYRFPTCLHINHVDSGANAAGIFLQKVERVTAEFGEPEDGSGYITYTEPAPSDYCPEAAMVSYVDFLGKNNAADGTWTITMKNGDVIQLHQTINVELIETYDYYPEDKPMGTIEELQALVDEIAENVDPSAVVNIHLPAVTYEGSLVMEKRPVNLCGSTSGEARTTFTNTIRVASKNSWITYIQDVDFAGNGKGVGISASGRLHVVNCCFTDWKTAVLSYGYTWVNIQQSRFENNEIGFHFNCTGASVSHTQYTGNQFINNGTALLLESVPTDVTMTFDECLFSGNGKDIDNRCDQSLDISEAIFQ